MFKSITRKEKFIAIWGVWFDIHDESINDMFLRTNENQGNILNKRFVAAVIICNCCGSSLKIIIQIGEETFHYFSKYAMPFA